MEVETELITLQTDERARYGPLGGDGPKGGSHQQDRIWSEATRRHHERFGKPFETPGVFHAGQSLVGNQPLVRDGPIRLSGRTGHPSSGNRRSVQRTYVTLRQFTPDLPPPLESPLAIRPSSLAKRTDTASPLLGGHD